MALYEDTVELTLGGDTVKIAENYQVRCSILTQPASFALRLGHGGVVADLFTRYPKHTPFELRVNGRLLQTGYTEGRSSGGDSGSQVTFKGRDVMGPLCSAYAPADKSFSNLSYHRLVSDVLDMVGLGEHLLIGSDAANRMAISGTQVVELQPATLDIITKQRVREGLGEGIEGTRKTTYRSITMKVGGRWYDWLKTQLDRAGLFLWASGEGAFILAVPTGDQRASYRIRRVERGGPITENGQVVGHEFEDNGETRFTKMIVYGRGGGRKAGRTKIVGEFVDIEMAAELGGENVKLITVHDNDVKTIEQARHYARRRMSEINREAYRLSYTVAGHSTIGADGNRAVWTPNTVVDVEDIEIGIRDKFWIEEVVMNGNPQRTTTLRLMRPRDLFFGTEATAA